MGVVTLKEKETMSIMPESSRWGNFPFFTEIFVLTKGYSFMDKGIVCKFTL